MIIRSSAFFVQITLFLPYSFAIFTEDFKNYLTDSYGIEIANKMERIDMGPDKLGSFGGKKSGNDTVTKQVNKKLKDVLLNIGTIKASNFCSRYHK